MYPTTIYEFLKLQQRLQIGMKEANPTQGGDPYEMTDEELAVFITWNHTALIKELGEMMDEVGWKPWASSRHIHRGPAIHEMVDAFHFFLNIMLAIGAWRQRENEDEQWPLTMVAMEFCGYYAEKNTKNLQRQIDGYDGVAEKCAHCHRDLSEVDSLRLYTDGTFKFCNKEHADLFVDKIQG